MFVRKTVLMMATVTSAKSSAVITIWLASSRRPSPRLRATKAERDTLIAMKTDNAINFGCAVSPTAATAEEPRELTISESNSPANAMKKDSKMAGHAI